MNQAQVTLRWERVPYSRIPGEEYADVSGVGRYIIRKIEDAGILYELKLNGRGLTRSRSPGALREAAALDLLTKMRKA